MQRVYNPSMIRTRPPSAKEVAYEHLKARIASVDLRDGAFLTEAEIATELGVSRTPVREAFLRLEGEGLLQLVPQKGAFVPPLAEKEIDDVIESREVVEVHCARNLTEDGRLHSDLQELVEEQRGLTSDVEAFIACDRTFHERMVDALGNPLLMDFYRSLRDRQMRMGIRAVVASPDRAKQVITEHSAIVKALRSAEEERIAAAVRAHLIATKAILKAES